MKLRSKYGRETGFMTKIKFKNLKKNLNINILSDKFGWTVIHLTIIIENYIFLWVVPENCY